MAVSFQNVEGQARAEAERGSGDQTRALRKLDARQRKALALFVDAQEVTGQQIADLFSLKARAAALLAQGWVEGGFLMMSNASKIPLIAIHRMDDNAKAATTPRVRS